MCKCAYVHACICIMCNYVYSSDNLVKDKLMNLQLTTICLYDAGAMLEFIARASEISC